MGLDRIKYYSTNDIMCGNNLHNIDKLINKFDDYESIYEVQNINDMIELYNAKKYFDNEIFLSDWSNENIREYKSAIKRNFSFVARFFKSINQQKFIQFYNDVQRNYKGDFWTLVDKFNIYKKISKEKFEILINTSDVNLYELLKHKKITRYFGEEIRNNMLNDDSVAKLLLGKYEIQYIIEKPSLYLPQELTN